MSAAQPVGCGFASSEPSNKNEEASSGSSQVQTPGVGRPLAHTNASHAIWGPQGQDGGSLPPAGVAPLFAPAAEAQSSSQVAKAGFGRQIAPFPRMHTSPLAIRPVVPKRRTIEKPLVGYHAGVKRLFRVRENVWIHRPEREVALDTWGSFAPVCPEAEYWALEEYDPLNPLVWDPNLPRE